MSEATSKNVTPESFFGRYISLKFVALIVVSTVFLLNGVIDGQYWFYCYTLYVGLRTMQKSMSPISHQFNKSFLDKLFKNILSREAIGFYIASYILWKGHINTEMYLTTQQWFYTVVAFVGGNMAAKYNLFDTDKMMKAVSNTVKGG